MGIFSNSSNASFLFNVFGSTTEMPVVSFSATEWMSLPFSLTVGVATQFEIKSFDNIIGKESLLTLTNNDILFSATDRYFHGVVRRFEYTGMSGRKFLYEAEIVPAIFFMSLRKNCRIFQEKQTQEIIKALLEEAGILSNRYRFALYDEERKRGFCVQYQESDLDFISRLMKEEGIYYFFEHYEDKHILVISDDKSVHKPIDGNPMITCNSGGMLAEKEYISDFTFSQRQTPEAFTHSNFNFKKPGLNLTQNKTDSEQPHYEIYDYAALHTSQAKGDVLAKVRMEQLVALQKQGHGHSTSCRLTTGYKFILTDHNSESLNIEYLLTDVSHAGSQPQTLEERGSGSASYSNQFTVIPAKIQYRPPIMVNRPVVTGLQTAIVVGPKGEEIHTDEHGRVKVQFHWDREGKNDQKSSCWLRVAQAWGGGGFGAQFIPRIGDEVLVDFIEGNPDRPLITGSVYNGDNLPINSLKKSITQSGFRTKTHKGEGFNELRFDDANGAQEVYLQAEKDFNVMVKHNRTETVYLNKAESIGMAKALSVGAGYAVTVGGAMNTGVGLAQFEEVGLSKKIAVGKSFDITVVDSFSITCGKSVLTMDKEGNITINGSKFDLGASDHIQLTSKDIDID